MKKYKIFYAKVNDKILKAARENWNWKDAEKSLKEVYGNDANIEFLGESIYTDEDLKTFKLKNQI